MDPFARHGDGAGHGGQAHHHRRPVDGERDPLIRREHGHLRAPHPDHGHSDPAQRRSSVMEEEIHKQAATLALARRVRDAMLILTQDQLGKAIINAKGVEFYRALKRQVMAAGRTEVVYATQAEKAVGFLKGPPRSSTSPPTQSTYIGNLLGTPASCPTWTRGITPQGLPRCGP